MKQKKREIKFKPISINLRRGSNNRIANQETHTKNRIPQQNKRERGRKTRI